MKLLNIGINKCVPTMSEIWAETTHKAHLWLIKKIVYLLEFGLVETKDMKLIMEMLYRKIQNFKRLEN